jgi:hypothetical protein
MAEEPFALSTIPPPPPVEGDYDAICATVRQSARGRWFLDEYARRNRNADTRVVLAAIEHLETVVQGSRDREAYQSMRGDLLEMARTIAVTRAEVAESKAEARTEDKPAVERQPAAGSDVFAMAERIQDVAWTMRERGLDPRTCEQIDALATTILSASALRDPNDHRTRKLGEVLQYLERRIDQMLDACANEAPSYEAPGDEPAPATTERAAPEAEPRHAGNGYGNGYGNGHAAQGVDALVELPVTEAIPEPAPTLADAAPALASAVRSRQAAVPDPLPATAVGEAEPAAAAFVEPPALAAVAEPPAPTPLVDDLDESVLEPLVAMRVEHGDTGAVPAVRTLEPLRDIAPEPLAQPDIAEVVTADVEVAVPGAEPRASEVAQAEAASAPLQSEAVATSPGPVAAISLPASQLLPPAHLDLPAAPAEPAAAEPAIAAVEIGEPAAAQAQTRPRLEPAATDLLAALMAMSDEERIALFT